MNILSHNHKGLDNTAPLLFDGMEYGVFALVIRVKGKHPIKV